jgi:hypothetical protein
MQETPLNPSHDYPDLIQIPTATLFPTIMKKILEDRNWRKGLNCLQDVSSETEETSKGSAGESECLVAGVGLNWGGGWCLGWDSSGTDLSWGDGGVWVNWCVGWANRWDYA